MDGLIISVLSGSPKNGLEFEITTLSSVMCGDWNTLLLIIRAVFVKDPKPTSKTAEIARWMLIEL